MNKRRIVIGDIHGELNGLREILRHAELADEQDKWTGNGSILIQTGDVIDRGTHSVESVYLLRRLQQQAQDSGGKVIRLCGNHELMLLQGDRYFVNFENPDRLSEELKQEIIKGDVLASYTDGIWLYTHAGLRSEIRNKILTEIAAENPDANMNKNVIELISIHLNKVFKKSVQSGKYSRHPIFHADRVRGGNDKVGGIFWGDFSFMRESGEASVVPQIFGHTPTRKKEVACARGLRLIDIDAGMCKVYGGHRVYIELTSEGEIIQHSKNNKSWDAKVIGTESSVAESHRPAGEKTSANKHFTFGKQYLEDGRQEEAFEAFRNAISLNPDYAEAYEELVRLCKQLCFDKQNLVYLENTIELFQCFLTRHPDSTELKNDLCSDLSWLAAYMEKTWDRIDIYKKLINIDPDYPGVYEHLLDSYHGYPEITREILYKAHAAFSKALKQEPDNPHIKKNMAEIYFGFAEDLLARVKGRDFPDEIWVLNVAEAISAYMHAIKFNPEHSDVAKKLERIHDHFPDYCRDSDAPEIE